MSRGTGRRWRSAVITTGVVAAGLASAASAQAGNVRATTGPSGKAGWLEITGWQPGERNDITVTPSGAVPDQDAIDPAFPLAPTTVVVTDAATPLGVDVGCIRLSANSASCTVLTGIDTVDANLGTG